MVGGHESTANSVVWCLHMLAIHPSVQTRLRAAIREVITEDSFTYESVNSIDYLDCVIKEVTRLYASCKASLPLHHEFVCSPLLTLSNQSCLCCAPLYMTSRYAALSYPLALC